jgi:gluconolactonase
MTMVPEIPIENFEIFAAGLDHPEGLAFDRDGFLWAGGEAGQIYRIDAAGRPELITTLGGFCAGLAFSPRNDLYVCNTTLGVVKVNRDGSHDIFAARAGTHKMVCPNYPIFDRSGNLYVTDSGRWKKRNGCLMRFDRYGTGEILAGPLGYANGLALSTDEKYLFVAESDTRRVYRCDLSDHTSDVVCHTYAEEVGRTPDGLVLDSEDNLYVCCYASDEIYRIDRDGNKSLFAHDPDAILLGGPTNAAFGRESVNYLYVANLCRYSISRVKMARRGLPFANQRHC